VRFLIKPPPGYALLYCDWSGQEYGEAAYFSGDQKMIADYANDDPYLGFAKRINLAPQDATKQTHPKLRDQLKVAAGLGVLYGAQAPTVARAGNMTESKAQRVLREHRYTYPQFWRWREQVINHARLAGELRTCLGWKWRVCGDDSTNSISNWMMQAHGADMLRVACCLAVEQGIEVCTPVHDALLVLAPVDAIEDVRNATVACMEEASSVILGGPKLKVGVDAPVIYPNRFSDKRGEEMWNRLQDILLAVENSSG
jgi:DNA polymerase I-like protein with 3'-5' exonuclease and polymerase domains